MGFYRIAIGMTLCGLLALPAGFVRADDAPASQPAAVDPVDYKKLKEILPDTFGGIKRTKASGSRNGMAAMKFTTAAGEYHPDTGDARAEISIFDYAAVNGMIKVTTAWTAMDIDNDSDTEMTKTLTVNGYKAMETFKKDSKHGELMVVVADRFLVQITADALDPDAFMKAAQAVDLKKLEALGK